MEDQTKTGHTYYTVSSDIREQYDALVGNLDAETYMQDIHDAAEDFLVGASFLLNLVDRRTRRALLPDFELDTFTAETFYLYAIKGIPRFLMRSQNGALREMTAEELADMDFSLEVNTMVSYNEAFSAFPESWGDRGPAVSMIVVLNQFAARMKLDAAAYSGEERYLSIAELALLAGMREKSVRNQIPKELGATFNKVLQQTQVPASRAQHWLEGRRKFTPSQRLTSPDAIQAFLKIESEYFG